jgi:hypothetical protein
LYVHGPVPELALAIPSRDPNTSGLGGRNRPGEPVT